MATASVREIVSNNGDLMPRTKNLRKKASNTKHTDNDTEILQISQSQYQDMIENSENEAFELLENARKSLLDHLQKMYIQERAKIPKKFLKLPMSEIKHLTSFKTSDNPSMISSVRKADIINYTKSVKKNKRVTRSSSFADEGYRTTDSAQSGSRRSRSRAPKCSTVKRFSRSLSKANSQKLTDKPNTPANRPIQSNSYGVITPKCKPNTPMVILRRPKVGEVAVSMQGSPLLTAPIAREENANINIPLSDGTLLSLQPQAGLRLSQIPNFDENTMRDLNCLYANIKKVVEAKNKNKMNI